MDLKTILVILSLVIGTLLVVGPYLSSLINTAKEEIKQHNISQPQSQPQKTTTSTVTVQSSDLDCLISLVNGIEDKTVKDYLVDKVAPQIIRQKLK